MAECFVKGCDGTIEVRMVGTSGFGRGFGPSEEEARCNKCRRVFAVSEILAELEEVTRLWHAALDAAHELGNNPIFED